MTGLGLRRIKTFTVVFDHEGDASMLLDKSNLHVLRCCVFADIAQGFLGDAKEEQFRFARELLIYVVGLDGDLQRVLSPAASEGSPA